MRGKHPMGTHTTQRRSIPMRVNPPGNVFSDSCIGRSPVNLLLDEDGTLVKVDLAHVGKLYEECEEEVEQGRSPHAG